MILLRGEKKKEISNSIASCYIRAINTVSWVFTGSWIVETQDSSRYGSILYIFYFLKIVIILPYINVFIIFSKIVLKQHDQEAKQYGLQPETGEMWPIHGSSWRRTCKIHVFQRELPLCLDLVNQGTYAYIPKLQYYTNKITILLILYQQN